MYKRFSAKFCKKPPQKDAVVDIANNHENSKNKQFSEAYFWFQWVKIAYPY